MQNPLKGMISPRPRALHEDFAKFFEAPTRELLRDVLKRNVGEADDLDFKEMWPAPDKVAKHLLAMANSNGGCIVIGVRQNSDGSLDPCGLSTLRDKADIAKTTGPFLPPNLRYETLDFSFPASEYGHIAGKKFQVLFIEDVPTELPFVSRRQSECIREAAVYVRRGTTSTEATYEELQYVLNRRIETGYSSSHLLVLEDHLRQLKLSYSQIDRVRYRSPFEGLTQVLTLAQTEANRDYPSEGLDRFVARCINDKKHEIRKVLGLVSDLDTG